MPTRVLKTIHRPNQVAMDQIIRVAIVSRMHTRFRRCFDENVDWSYGCEIVTDTNVPMHELDTARAPIVQVLIQSHDVLNCRGQLLPLMIDYV